MLITTYTLAAKLITFGIYYYYLVTTQKLQEFVMCLYTFFFFKNLQLQFPPLFKELYSHSTGKNHIYLQQRC
jgi:ribose/xylose/arabinose/galactoside ABC-type transport system permease subunit